MKKIGEVFGHPVSRLKYEKDEFFDTIDSVGVEIEFEDVNHSLRNDIEGFDSYWRTTQENSIRNNGVEYVFTSPFWGRDLMDALNIMERFIDISIKNKKLQATERCSVHVHVDIRELTGDQYKNFILIANSVEPLLFKISGNRNNNIYCLPPSEYYKGDELIQEVYNKNIPELAHVFTKKYSSINTIPVRDFGSVEFRHHEGSLDIERIKRWVKSLINIKRYSMEVDKFLDDLPSFVSQKGFVEYIQDVFKDQSENYLYAGFHMDLLEGVRTAQEGIFLNLLRLTDKNNRKKGDGSLFKNFFIKNESNFITKES